MKFILLDTETTGTTQTDKICQLAFIEKEGQNIEYFMDYCKPSVEVSFKAMSINHITNEMLEDKPDISKTASFQRLKEINTSENILIIHNAKFDLEMLKKDGFESKMLLIDTLRCIKRLEEDLESHSLQFLRYALGFYKQEDDFAQKLNVKIQAHDALGDIIVLNFLMSYLIQKVGRKDAINTLIKYTNEPILIKKIKFGKHKDKTLEEIALSDPSYLDWLSKTDIDEDLKYSINYYLKK